MNINLKISLVNDGKGTSPTQEIPSFSSTGATYVYDCFYEWRILLQQHSYCTLLQG